jgi:hypothetical protein
MGVRREGLRKRKRTVGKGGCHSQFEKCIGDLEHENVWMTVIVYNQYSFYSSAHAEVFIVVLKTLQTSRDRRVFFWLSFFCTVSIFNE